MADVGLPPLAAGVVTGRRSPQPSHSTSAQQSVPSWQGGSTAPTPGDKQQFGITLCACAQPATVLLGGYLA